MDTIRMGHGAGGRMMADLIQEIFLPLLDNPLLRQMADATVLSQEERSPLLAVSTDSFVVRPLFFPGGDIGSLAVHGTVNDLAMRGARPLWLTAAFILEEGLPLEGLQRIVRSMASAAWRAGVAVVAGDTKVVERGHGTASSSTRPASASSRPAWTSVPPHLPGDVIPDQRHRGRPRASPS